MFAKVSKIIMFGSRNISNQNFVELQNKKVLQITIAFSMARNGEVVNLVDGNRKNLNFGEM